MGTVRIDGEVKQITTGRKEDKEGNIKLVARVLIEFTPTEKGISELQDLIAMQCIARPQLELQLDTRASGTGVQA